MSYDPFARGSAPVRVRTCELCDETRGVRLLPLELGYPAHERHRGQDLDDAVRDPFAIAPGIARSAQRAVRGVDSTAARPFLSGDLVRAFAARDIALEAA